MAEDDLYDALERMTNLFRDLAGDQSTETGWKNDELLAAWQQAMAALAKSRIAKASGAT